MALRIAMLAWLFLIPITLSAQDKPIAPIGFPPHVGTGKTIDRDGKPQIELRTASLVPETVTTTVARGGKQERSVTTRYKTVIETSAFYVFEKDAVTFEPESKSVKATFVTGLEGVKVYHKNGTIVPKEALPRLFAKERAVVVFGGEELDPYYLRVLNDEVLILTGAANLVFPRNGHEAKGR